MTSSSNGLFLTARSQRGFTSLETIVGLAILSVLMLATASALGMRPPRAHAAAVALEAALVEARSLAPATADETDPASTTGATVYVSADPSDPQKSIVSVYRSRPIPNPGRASPSRPLAPDPGFPPQRVAATLTVFERNIPMDGPFAILISSSGYTSVAAPLGWDPGRSGAVLAADPGCASGAVAISADDGARRETHELGCHNAIYDASS